MDQKTCARINFWICVVHAAGLGLLLGIPAVLSGGFPWLPSQLELPNPLVAPVRVVLLHFFDVFGPVALYALAASAAVAFHFYQTTRSGQEGQSLVSHVLLYAPLLLWCGGFMVGYVLLYAQGAPTYEDSAGEVVRMAGPPRALSWVLGLAALLLLPLALRIEAAIVAWTTGHVPPADSTPTSAESGRSQKMLLVGAAVAALVLLAGGSFYAAWSARGETKPSLPHRRFREQLRESPNAYSRSRFRKALKLAQGPEEPTFPYLVGASLGRHRLSLMWSAPGPDLAALEFRTKDGRRSSCRLDVPKESVIRMPQHGAAPLLLYSLRAIEFRKELEVPELEEDEWGQGFLTMPAPAAGREMDVRLIDGDGDKSNWAPLHASKVLQEGAEAKQGDESTSGAGL